jgi:Fe-S cluster biogenesis protein NfuA
LLEGKRLVEEINCSHPENLGGRNPADCSAEQRRICHPPKTKSNNSQKGDSNRLKEKVQAALDKIRPALQADGGDVELVDVKEQTGVVMLRLTGHCAGCPMSQMTLKNGIERVLKSEIPEVKTVLAV